jgi:hypothetical protein
MNADQLKALQRPLKEQYQRDPGAARITLTAGGSLDPDVVSCRVVSHLGTVTAGLRTVTPP